MGTVPYRTVITFFSLGEEALRYEVGRYRTVRYRTVRNTVIVFLFFFIFFKNYVTSIKKPRLVILIRSYVRTRILLIIGAWKEPDCIVDCSSPTKDNSYSTQFVALFFIKKSHERDQAKYWYRNARYWLIHCPTVPLLVQSYSTETKTFWKYCTIQ